MAFGFSSSKSDSAGAPIGSSDTFANDNAYASAPVINFNDTRKGSGKRFIQEANHLTVNTVTTDYGAVHDSFVMGKLSLEAMLESQKLAANQSEKALEQVGTFSSSVLSVIDQNSRELMDNSRRVNAYAADSITNNLKSALMFAEKQSQPDKGVFSDSVKYLIAGGVAIFGLAAWGGKRG